MLSFWFWILLVLTISGAFMLVFYITISFNELEKVMGELTKELIKKYGKADEK